MNDAKLRSSLILALSAAQTGTWADALASPPKMPRAEPSLESQRLVMEKAARKRERRMARNRAFNESRNHAG